MTVKILKEPQKITQPYEKNALQSVDICWPQGGTAQWAEQRRVYLGRVRAKLFFSLGKEKRTRRGTSEELCISQPLLSAAGLHNRFLWPHIQKMTEMNRQTDMWRESQKSSAPSLPAATDPYLFRLSEPPDKSRLRRHTPWGAPPPACVWIPALVAC